MNMSSPGKLKRLFSIEDFFDFGERYGIDFHFPALSSCRDQAKEKRIVVQGDVEEMALSSGIYLTNSNVRVLQPYESTSLQGSPLYTLVVLEGCVALRLNGEAFVVRSGMAFSTRLGEHLVMNASHLADHHLKTISLGINPGNFQPAPLVTSLLHEWQREGTPAFVWQVPGYLLSGLQHALENTAPGLSRQFMLEGVMLQLLGYGLSFGQRGREKRYLSSPGEQNRLENVRRLLERQPESAYTLHELAQLAAMSASSLRTKFRQAYGHSVFDYLRDCRLELARRYLAQGYSVQQAAWMSGYQHATNFSTAFRRRYGIAPSDARATTY
ncbi:AraC-like DNA-binding protein|uniref:AraC-like DNA-binding protein n=1 Tax=Brenneria salicis ATCC 15712 = DSM 30166 TaxID=714314 RepID=A0A366I1V5_9GAMM|nr:helix-turn-helix transcriptional regulator [Brenneria salicis]NMN90374.1 AraC-like DNA-binding protein [Brenneria salicis ATCC 15712 = DSM 30166]RBP59626.1 AraC-like DNA-binding protein [Brenneria salicis ATCC 15712 = DSM 30166]RLM29788.1 AraC family transcriptional regulator [Brenneria salicis ATCC 15712 = DSM 30166]